MLKFLKTMVVLEILVEEITTEEEMIEIQEDLEEIVMEETDLLAKKKVVQEMETEEEVTHLMHQKEKEETLVENLKVSLKKQNVREEANK